MSHGAVFVFVGAVIFLLLVLVGAIAQGTVEGVRGFARFVATRRALARSF